MAVHIAGSVQPAELDENEHGLSGTVQHCARCGRRLTRPFQRFPVGARVEVTEQYTTIVLGGVPDCEAVQ